MKVILRAVAISVVLAGCSLFWPKDARASDILEEQLRGKESLFSGVEVEDINDFYYNVIDSLELKVLIPTTKTMFTFYREECLPKLLSNSGIEDAENWMKSNKAKVDHYYNTAFKYSVSFAAIAPQSLKDDLKEVLYGKYFNICRVYSIEDVLRPDLW